MTSLTAIFGNSDDKPVEESEKLLELYWNRAELKKEFADLRKEQFHLQDHIKQQEGVTARVQQKLDDLEQLLNDPEWVYNVIIFYQLRNLSLRCQNKLEKFAEQLKQQREQRRRRRNRRGVPVLSIVGYTNAGKSTLLRSLTDSDPFIEDKMFATLDPMSRRLRFPREREVIITDTVGFIRDLPRELVAAFHATLEELRDALLLLHVVDASAPDIERRIEAVHEVLEDIGLSEIPELLIFNQADRLPDGVVESIARRHGGIAVSALKKQGLRELLVHAEEILWGAKSPEVDRRILDKLVIEAEGV